MLPAAVADVKHNYLVTMNREKHSVLMGFAAIEQLANLIRKLFVFRGEWAAVGQFCE
jgi:hypothetical protein